MMHEKSKKKKMMIGIALLVLIVVIWITGSKNSADRNLRNRKLYSSPLKRQAAFFIVERRTKGRSPGCAFRASLPAPTVSFLDIRLPFFSSLLLAQVEFRVDGVEVFAVQIILHDTQAFAEPLEMNDLTLPEEADRIDDIRIVHHAENVVIGGAGFLFCCNCERTTCN